MQEQERKWIRISFQRLPENKRSGKESSHHTKKWYDPSQPHVSPPSDISALLIFCSSSFHYLLHINARCSYYHRKIPTAQCCRPNICIGTSMVPIHYAQRLSRSACWDSPSIFSYQASPVNPLLWHEGQ